jgi:glutathione synthase/RimK-type ligase-like ATP-grasp enzyme
VRLTRTRRYRLLRNGLKELLPLRFPEPGPVDDGPSLEEAEPVLMAWPENVPRPRVGLVPDIDPYPYWTKYRRFLVANGIPYELYDIHHSSWLADAERFDLVLWRPASYPYELEECRRKFHLLETRLGMLCCPSVAEMQLYEDKIAQYEVLTRHGFPMAETFISESEAETRAFLAQCSYPLVWKLTTASGSLGVELVTSRRQAERMVRKVFNFCGRRTYWPYLGQKDYVYLQRFLPEARFDMRVIVVGECVFGYYRDAPRGEFRASGMNRLRWEEPPTVAAIKLARRVASALGMSYVAVDVLVDRQGELRIIELSNSIQVQEPWSLRRGSVAGAYVFDGPGDHCRFVPMRVWIQELCLRNVLQVRWLTREHDALAGEEAVAVHPT